jgi:hypothetical protein
VLDIYNKTIIAPNAFQINTSIQRCLVKAIALHGLGLYIYAGEDLPEAETVKHVLDVPANDITPEQIELMKEKAAEIVDFCSHNLFEDAFVVYDNVSDMAERNELWKLLAPNSAVRAKLKAIGTEKRKQADKG